MRLASGELARQQTTLSLVASASPTLPPALLAQSLLFSSVTAEGYVGSRYHPGTDLVDQVEQLAIDRATELFGVPYVNVQPLSGSAANLAVLYGLVDQNQSVLAMDLAHGGHLTHVSRAASVSKRIEGHFYGLDERGFIDFDQVEQMAMTHRPGMIICGGSSYSREIDFERFRDIAERSGSLLLADISHISGLVAAGQHVSPVPYCDIITTSTYKQLCGPRGGLIMLGSSSRVTERRLRHAVFPGFQGTPDFGGIAAKAVAFGFALQPTFRQAMTRVRRFAAVLAAEFATAGLTVAANGTDTHMVLIDLRTLGDSVTGRVVSDALLSAGLMINKNLVPGDHRPPTETSGLRIGTNHLGFSAVDESTVRRLARAISVGVFDIAQSGAASNLDTVREITREISESGFLEGWPGITQSSPFLV